MSGVTKERLYKLFKRQGELEIHMGQVENYMQQIDKHQVQMGTATAKYLSEFHEELKLLHKRDAEVRSLPLVRFSLWLRDLKLWVKSFFGGQDEQEKHVDVSGTDVGDDSVGATDADGAGADPDSGVEGDSGGGGAENREAATGSAGVVGPPDDAADSDSPEPGPASGGDNPDVEEPGGSGPGELGSGPAEPKGEEEATAT